MTIMSMNTLAMGWDVERLDAFIDWARRSETMAPFIDPTAYMRGGDKLRLVIRSAEALRTYAKTIQDLAATESANSRR